MRVLLACGGTGGHVFPAFSLAEELRRRSPDTRIHYACGEKDIETRIFRIVEAEEVSPVTSAPFRGARSLASPFFWRRLARGYGQARGLLRRFRPDVVVGFGGHSSFPVVAASRVAGIPTVLHEQNASPGFANRVLARWVDAVALSYDEAVDSLATRACRRVTGNPIRSSIERADRREALEFFGLSGQKRTVLVLGGSQGSQSLNAVLGPALGLLHASTRAQLQVLHLCGKMRAEEAEEALSRAGVDGRAFSFFDRMDLAYAAADAAVGRAGATFLAELDACGIPAMLVPYPFAGGHQTANALAHARRSEAEVVAQADLNPARLAAFLTRATQNPAQRRPPGPRANARQLLADFVVETLNRCRTKR